MLGTVSRDVDADLGQHLDGQGMDGARFGPNRTGQTLESPITSISLIFSF